MDKKLYEKITQKKEFSQLPKKDVELAFEKFDNEDYIDEEKVKLTRDLLRKVFSAFASQKLLSLKNKEPEWMLKKHLSTRERLPHYQELYEKLLGDIKREINLIDLGCGVNGFSYKYFENKKVNYIGIEAVGQLVELMNYHFKIRGIENCHAFHLSLFELGKIKKIIKKVKGNKVVFLFKTLDSLEMIGKDYSKKLLLEIVPLVDNVVVSFATRSMIKRKKFRANRKWLVNFIEESFKILDNFELGGEKYISFRKSKLVK